MIYLPSQPNSRFKRSKILDACAAGNDDKANIETVYLYDFDKIEPYIKVYLSIVEWVWQEKLGWYLKDFKEFLLKQEHGEFHVILRDVPWNIKDTKFYIKDYKDIVSFFKWRKKWARLFTEDREVQIPKDDEA